ncbi:HD domain-containing protein [Natroniella sulfidigena]|uniref:CCA tRNA nucleotidyltransferase n=1 Tax=Natroniella sulfidigena TaxID=723921 RepID=UPI00200B1754|nr:HD domain-containing protein [Natroniella sulfidigena]MCK8816948.1 HD domain-containing protein [Natroniella sulfidigena]
MIKELENLVKILAENNLDGFLVGGIVRDYLLERRIKDVDLVIEGQVKQIAQDFAAKIDASFVILDQKYDIYRVVKGESIYDFALLAGDDIEVDLKRRDFTINALAIKLTADFLATLLRQADIEEYLIDPLSGLDDIEHGSIKAVQADTFQADPIRLFRAVRFAARLDFTLEDQTKELMKEVEAKGIKRVAKERVREELIKLLFSNRSAQHLIELEEEFSLLSLLIPEIEKLKEIGQCKHHQEDVWTHSTYALQRLEELLREEFWSARIEQQRIPLLKLALLFHDLGKLWTEELIDGEVHFYDHQRVGANNLDPILSNLRFSKEEISYIKTLVRYHMRPMSLYYAENLTSKGKYRFFRAGGEFIPDICLVAAADLISTKELNNRTEEIAGCIRFLKKLIKEFEQSEERTKDRLVTGDQIMDILSIKQGPQVGKLLEQVREAQATGKVETEKEAIEYLKKGSFNNS